MIDMEVTIRKFESQGEKTGWCYLLIPGDVADQLNPGVKKSYRVKGRLDQFPVKGIAMIPMGDGSFIIAFNQLMRKGTAKKEGSMIRVRLSIDKVPYQLNAEFITCLKDEPAAFAFFDAMPPGHQAYYSKWIESAKQAETRSRRIAQAVEGLARKMNYSAMIQFNKNKP